MPADTPDHDLTPEQHRRLGTDLFNVTWTLLEKPDRTPAEIDSMIHAAQGGVRGCAHPFGAAAARASCGTICARSVGL